MRRAALAVVGLSTLAFAAPASATTETFNFTGAAQTWTVPTGVTEATFDLYGAEGGENPSGVFAAGLGGRATATIAVTPGAWIQVNVGGLGQVSPSTGGFNGGGEGLLLGGGGGGASDIRIGGTGLADRVLVAGGGGGRGACIGFGVLRSRGGDGGGALGEDAFTPSPCPVAFRTVGGGGGTQTEGGSATSPATEGDFGVGGNGAGGASVGGGGGGGWFGGGSGHGPEGTEFQTGVREGNGLVTVAYTAPTPTIADLIASVEGIDLPHGIENALLKKLTAAQRNLDAEDLVGACDKLASFINQVSAQSGKKIDADDAEGLIDQAEAVRADSLSCA